MLYTYNFASNRNVLRRMLPIQKCAFGKLSYKVDKILSTVSNADELALGLNNTSNFSSNFEGVVSFSFFGKYDNYYKNLLKNIELITQYLPEWITRIYVGSDIPQTMLNKFQTMIKSNLEIYIMNAKSIGYEGALWRFFPAGEDLPFISCDADNTITKNRADYIKIWVKKRTKPFITLSSYSSIIPLDAGSWGYNPKVKKIKELENIQDDINEYCEPWFGFDEAYLRIMIWPLFKKYGYYHPNNLYIREILNILLIIFIGILAYLTYKNINTIIK